MEQRSNRRKRNTATASFLACALLASGCSTRPAQSPDERLRSQAAQGARMAHHDVKAAGQEARQALHDAGRKTRDIVAGAREGWREGAAKDGPILGRAVDINHASVDRLAKLPGISATAAQRIVHARPYAAITDLRKRGLVSKEEYARIAGRITAK